MAKLAYTTPNERKVSVELTMARPYMKKLNISHPVWTKVEVQDARGRYTIQ